MKNPIKEKGEIMPKISVIIPVYNVEKYLPACLDSLLNQTFKDFEIICVNDGSTDNSGKILLDYSLRNTPDNPRIRPVFQKNQGISAARNSGLEEAEGDYIYFMDSDDFIHPQLLEIAYAHAKKNKADLVGFDFYRETVPGELTLDGAKKYENIDGIKTIIATDPMKYFKPSAEPRIYYNVWSKLIKRSFIRGMEFLPNVNRCEDMLFVACMLKQKPKTVLIPEKLYFYRKNDKSVTNAHFDEKHLQDHYMALTALRDTFQGKEYKDELNFILKNTMPDILSKIVKKIEASDFENKNQLLPLWRNMLSDLVKSKCIAWGQEVVKPKKRFLPYVLTAKHHVRILPKLERTLYESSRKRMALSRA